MPDRGAADFGRVLCVYGVRAASLDRGDSGGVRMDLREDAVSSASRSAPASVRAIFSELRNPAAVLLALLLFFQLGNEWALAGWLALFLTQRLGVSPPAALRMLALYWLALLVGRVAAQWVLPRVRHARLLVASAAASILGCVILIATDNQFGAAERHPAAGRRFRAHLSSGGGKDRTPFPVLPSRVLQRHLFFRHRGRAAGSLHAGLFRLAVGRRAWSWDCRWRDRSWCSCCCR